jgi:hypothetical protein
VTRIYDDDVRSVVSTTGSPDGTNGVGIGAAPLASLLTGCFFLFCIFYLRQ